MRSRVALFIGASGEKAREMLADDTPATLASSLDVIRFFIAALSGFYGAILTDAPSAAEDCLIASQRRANLHPLARGPGSFLAPARIGREVFGGVAQIFGGCAIAGAAGRA